METVYVVDFEDAHRGVVFATKEEAEKYAAAYCGGIDRHKKTAMEMTVRTSADQVTRELALRKLTRSERVALGLEKEFPLL